LEVILVGENHSFCGVKMSKKTVTQMEAELMDRIEKAKDKLNKLQHKHKLEIGTLAYKYGFHKLDTNQLELIFAKLAREVNHGSS
jgi:hypothetical protein